MKPNILFMLDQAELRQLALNASQVNDDAAAIAYLKEATSRADTDSVAHYLLGAHYAQIRMYDRAASSMESALALDPGMTIARFQLGLLWLTGGQSDKAQAVLLPLLELPESDGMRAFGQGLLHIVNKNLNDAIRSLQQGISLNVTNLPLNGDMQLLIDKLSANSALPPAPAATAPQSSPVLPPVAEVAPVNDDAYQRHLSMLAYAINKDK